MKCELRWMPMVALAVLAGGAAMRAGDAPAKAPDILFVSRRPLRDGGRGAIPGLGPRQRAAHAGGRLLAVVNGRVRGFGPPGFDASDPSGSPTRRLVARAGLADSSSPWRIRRGGRRHGVGVERELHVDREAASKDYDDVDPCFADDSTLIFASTRDGQRSEYDGSPVPQLFRIDLGTERLTQLTAERNGAEEPSLDRRT